MNTDGLILAIGGFADLWLYSEPDTRFTARSRDFRPDIVAHYGCPNCGARVGQLCRRRTIAGIVTRRLPHMGRGEPRHYRLPMGTKERRQ